MLVELAIAFAGWVGAEAHMDIYVGAAPVAVAPSTCHQRTVDRVMRVLPQKSPTRVLWADLDARQAWGLAFVDARAVVLSTAVPCDLTAAVLTHEWAHQATADEFGGTQAQADNAIGRNSVELVADCVGSVLTKKLGPVLDRKSVV